MFWPQKIPEDIPFSKKDKLCVMISGNKTNRDSRELYSERLNAIRYFEKNHPNDFDLYGTNWDIRTFRTFHRLNRFHFIRKILAEKRPSYRGVVNKKIDILSKYKFSFCYENAKDITGYITEKIFDSFFAGTIPIYLGAPNVKDFIPESTFIDKGHFSNYDELYDFIVKIDEDKYDEYIENIRQFLKSDKIRNFSAEFWADTLLKNIISSICD